MAIVPCGSGTPDKYAIIGFTTLELNGVYKGNDPLAIGSAGTPAQNGSCGNNGTALGNAGAGDGTLPGTQFGGWYLPDFADLSCGASKAADVIWNGTSGHPLVTVDPPKNNDPPLVRCTSVSPSPTPAGCDYFYNPTTKILSWWDLTSKNVGNKVKFDWTVNGTPATPGFCGVRSLRPERHLPGDQVARLHGSERQPSARVHRSVPKDTCSAILTTTLAQRA